MTKGRLAAISMATFLCVGPVHAQAAEAYPKPLQQAVDAGVKVVKSFPAASGLTGWVVSQGGRYTIVYSTADRKTLLAGALIGEDGASLSSQYEERYVPKPDLASLYAQLEKSFHVVEGAAKPAGNVLYVFVDPNCPYCHFTWMALQAYEKAGLQVRWIPVATLGPTSMPKAIEVMAASDRTAAFRRMEENHGKPWTASAASSEASHQDIAAKIRANNELMEGFGIAGTPGVIWKDKQGKVQIKGGMPRLSELPAITGLPEQKIDDPALAKFR
ncbi:thiol:disulfide interchange protein DsbG [Noviherbaspirillum pedocola]|nr:thiol:disulfide interchange protein DsbG [Noviherbaspirillum pedocola]